MMMKCFVAMLVLFMATPVAFAGKKVGFQCPKVYARTADNCNDSTKCFWLPGSDAKVKRVDMKLEDYPGAAILACIYENGSSALRQYAHKSDETLKCKLHKTSGYFSCEVVKKKGKFRRTREKSNRSLRRMK